MIVDRGYRLPARSMITGWRFLIHYRVQIVFHSNLLTHWSTAPGSKPILQSRSLRPSGQYVHYARCVPERY